MSRTVSLWRVGKRCQETVQRCQRLAEAHRRRCGDTWVHHRISVFADSMRGVADWVGDVLEEGHPIDECLSSSGNAPAPPCRREMSGENSFELRKQPDDIGVLQIARSAAKMGEVKR